MFTKSCPNCQKQFALANVRMDDHWSKWSLKPAHCYCPHCGAQLDDVQFDSVDLARHLTPRHLVSVAFFIVATLAGLASGTLSYVGPMLVGGFGLWLARNSSLRDHRVVGWILALVSVGALYAFVYAA